jgi:hypothetical protein
LAFASFSLNIATRPAIRTFPALSTERCHFDPVSQTGRFGLILFFLLFLGDDADDDYEIVVGVGH